MTPSLLRRWLIRLLLIALILAAAYVGWRKYSTPAPLPVNVAEVGYGRVEATVANTRAGTVKPCRRAKLAPQGGGQIARLLVKEGDRVSAGQVLLELWNVDLAAQIRLAEEQVGSVKARRNEACTAAQAARPGARSIR